tara:strand:+ start:390 stop:797 length:408 start_codon:yes stop_codon:yes gene_type:complete
MASQLKVDTLTGVTTAGSILVTGEGNSTTTNLQQGLVKLFAHSNQSSNAIEYGFNTSSYTDSATGSYILNATSAFTSKVNLVSTANSQPQSTNVSCINHMSEGSSTSSAMKFTTIENNAGKDQPFNHNTVHGDLA